MEFSKEMILRGVYDCLTKEDYKFLNEKPQLKEDFYNEVYLSKVRDYSTFESAFESENGDQIVSSRKKRVKSLYAIFGVAAAVLFITFLFPIFGNESNPPVERGGGINIDDPIEKIDASILQELAISSNDIELNFIVSEIECETKNSISKITEGSKVKPTLKVGNCIKFDLKNEGKENIYFSIVDLPVDDLPQILLPQKSKYNGSILIAPQTSYTSEIEIEITPPIGEEAISLLASLEPFDLNNVLLQNDQETRSPIQQYSEIEKYLFYQLTGTKVELDEKLDFEIIPIKFSTTNE